MRQQNAASLKKGSSAAQYEMKLLLEDYEYKKAQLDAVMEEIEKLCRKIPESEQMLAISGRSNHGSLFWQKWVMYGRFESPTDVWLADSHYGRTALKRQRTDDHKQKEVGVLQGSAVQCSNSADSEEPRAKSLHEYYTTRANNPLKKKQSVIAISCKLLRAFMPSLQMEVTYDSRRCFLISAWQPQAA